MKTIVVKPTELSLNSHNDTLTVVDIHTINDRLFLQIPSFMVEEFMRALKVNKTTLNRNRDNFPYLFNMAVNRSNKPLIIVYSQQNEYSTFASLISIREETNTESKDRHEQFVETIKSTRPTKNRLERIMEKNPALFTVIAIIISFVIFFLMPTILEKLFPI